MSARDEYEAATAEGRRMLATIPHAVAARYDRQADRIVVTLSTGPDVYSITSSAHRFLPD